jgi:hypothetical protein
MFFLQIKIGAVHSNDVPTNYQLTARHTSIKRDREKERNVERKRNTQIVRRDMKEFFVFVFLGVTLSVFVSLVSAR